MNDRLINTKDLIVFWFDDEEGNRTLEFVPKEIIDAAPTIDAERVVRCKDCKHRIVNEHYGEKGYIKLKAYCELDTGDIFELGRCAEEDDWFCADGERKDGV